MITPTQMYWLTRLDNLAALAVVADDMAASPPDIVLANPRLSNVSEGCKEVARRRAEKDPGGGGLWRLRK